MDLQNDINNLKRDYPECSCFDLPLSGHVDLLKFLPQVTKVETKTKDKQKKEGGLAKLCRHFLRKALDKSEQISDWSRRPLRWTQLLYAANDAAASLQIYLAAIKERV